MLTNNVLLWWNIFPVLHMLILNIQCEMLTSAIIQKSIKDQNKKREIPQQKQDQIAHIV